MSMKKKLVTAVTAASLLATVFGSSVLAARSVAPDAPVAKRTTVAVGADITQITAKKSYVIVSSGNNKVDALDDFDGLMTLTFGKAAAGDIAAADVKATSSNSNILVAWLNPAELTENACSDALVLAALATTDTYTSLAEDTAGDGDYGLCITAKTATTAATGTITVSAGASASGKYATMVSFTVTAVGPLASLTLSITDGYRYVANDNVAVEDWLKLVGKDANGTVLNGKTGSLSAIDLDGAYILAEYGDNPENFDEDAINFFAEDSSATATDTAVQYYGLAGGACTSSTDEDVAGDEGQSYSLKVFADLTTDVVSNAITITCTEGADGARLVSAAADATSGTGVAPQEGTPAAALSIDVIGSFVDAAGRPLGDGSDAEFDLGCDETSADDKLDLLCDDAVTVVGGKGVVANLQPGGAAGDALTRFGKYAYKLTYADSDKAASGADIDVYDDENEDNVSKVVKLTYTAVNPTSITRVMNKALTSATIRVNVGDENEGELVTFTVESATGAISVFNREVDENGFATLVLGRRNTTVLVQAGLKSNYVRADKDFGTDVSDASDILTITYK